MKISQAVAGLVVVLFSGCSISNSSSVPKDVTHGKQPVVQTASGLVKGLSSDGVDSFRGIPFAAPPVGAYRWRPPQPVTAWSGVRDATKFGPDCAQASWPRGADSLLGGSSEDCLYLNLWLPAGTQRNAKLPVMVWIHGGGFVGGSGSQPDSFGTAFANKNVILVTINYRLGRFGFFAFPSLRDEHPDEATGNYGYMDQIAALRWVQKNIAAFGGNSENVTIFGESAGGVSVHSLITIPEARGLFAKAIIESGGGRDGVLTGRPIDSDNSEALYPVSAETIGINFARKHGILGTDSAALAKLRALPVEEIVDGGLERDESSGSLIYSGPILDGKLVVETAQSAYEAGRIADIPIIIGSNSAEVPAGFVNAKSKEELFSSYGNLKDEMIAAYDPDHQRDFPAILTMVNTDSVWAEPARFTARAFNDKGIPAYVYLFSYVSPSMKDFARYGAPHASEIPYVFNNLRSMNGAAIDPQDMAVAEMMNSYWANFAKTGNPNGNGLSVWPRFTAKNSDLMEFRADGLAKGVPDPKKARLDAIEKSLRLRRVVH